MFTASEHPPKYFAMDPSLFGASAAYIPYGLALPSSASAYVQQQQQQQQQQYGAASNGSAHALDHSADPSSSTSPRESPANPTNLVLTIRLLMQGKEVGSIIGKRGDQIKKIREESGAKINISDGSCPERIVTITGTLSVINKAFTMVCNKFEEDMLMLPNSVPKPPITMRLIVPATQCGSLIGKGGTKIKDIREATGASIQVASEMLPHSTERAVTISGNADAINLCMAQVCQILLEAPPKGATISYRPKPTFNPLLIASSAAAAAAQQQQQQLAALLPPQNAQLAALLQQQQQLAAAAAAQQMLSPELATRAALLNGQLAYLPASAPPVSHHQLNPQELALFGGGVLMAAPTLQTAGADGQQKLTEQQVWQHAADSQQQQLLSQYAALNSSMLMGAPFVKGGPSPPGTHPAAAHALGQANVMAQTGASGPVHHHHHHKQSQHASSRFNPY